MDFAYYGIKNGRAIPVVGLCGYRRIDEKIWGFEAIVWYSGCLTREEVEEFDLTPLPGWFKNEIMQSTLKIAWMGD